MAEFQRRRGDTVVFSKVLHAVRAHIEGDVTLTCSMSKLETGRAFDTAETEVVVGCNGEHTSETELRSAAWKSVAYLIGLTQDVDDSELQAEFVSALRALAEEDQYVAQCQCPHQLRSALEKLVGVDDTRIAYTTARLMSALAQYPEGTRIFLDKAVPKLTMLMFTKIDEHVTSKVLKEHLALSLRRIVQHCSRESLTADVTADLLASLRKSLQCPAILGGTICAQTFSCLKDALSILMDRAIRKPLSPRGPQMTECDPAQFAVGLRF
jgi:hypothetical protein